MLGFFFCRIGITLFQTAMGPVCITQVTQCSAGADVKRRGPEVVGGRWRPILKYGYISCVYIRRCHVAIACTNVCEYACTRIFVFVI